MDLAWVWIVGGLVIGSVGALVKRVLPRCNSGKIKPSICAFLEEFSTIEATFPQLFPIYPHKSPVLHCTHVGIHEERMRAGMTKKRRSFDPRRHWRQTQVRLLLGGLLVVIVVGGGFVWVLYGLSAALTTVACLLGAAGVLGLLWLFLSILELWVKDEES